MVVGVKVEAPVSGAGSRIKSRMVSHLFCLFNSFLGVFRASRGFFFYIVYARGKGVKDPSPCTRRGMILTVGVGGEGWLLV